ncbi:MAG: hypothetical protein Q9191_006031 [Dirinaria sp. TL-2023a]
MTQCCVLPAARNGQFFGRENTLAVIDDVLQPGKELAAIRSLAIYGPPGVGKTQTALEYAYRKQAELDAILWLSADNTLALQQGFTEIAVHGLKMENAESRSHQENKLLVVAWLQRTCAKWLMIFDDVQNHQILETCLRATDHGAILVTTRQSVVAITAAEQSVPITDFAIENSTKFILHLLQQPKGTPQEQLAAQELSSLLHGYPLTISLLTAFINAHNLPVEDFLSTHMRYPANLYRKQEESWEHIGYRDAHDTVWNVSFRTLDPLARACLCILSFYAPHSIPTALLPPKESVGLPVFCKEGVSCGDAIEQLTCHALVKYHRISQQISLHRVVQGQCHSKATPVEYQEGFDVAVKLLLDKFPDRGSLVFMASSWEDGAKYIGHIVSVADNWRASQNHPIPLKPTVEFCHLVADCAWFVHDNDTAGILSLLMDAGCHAYYKLPDAAKQPILEADILLLLCIQDLRAEGDFDSAHYRAMKSLAIREKLGQPQQLQISSCYHHLAIALDSMGWHDEARSWLSKAREILESHNDELHIRLLCHNNLHFSRNLFSVGDFDGAEKKLDQAMILASGLGDSCTLASIHQTKADLYLRWEKLAEAIDHIYRAGQLLKGSADVPSVSWLSGIVSYRFSCICVKQNGAVLAIWEAKNALAIARLCHMPLGMRARFQHLLMKAYLIEPDRYEKEANQARGQAQWLRSLLPSGKTNLSDESDQAFDMLVDISLR